MRERQYRRCTQNLRKKVEARNSSLSCGMTDCLGAREIGPSSTFPYTALRSKIRESMRNGGDKHSLDLLESTAASEQLDGFYFGKFIARREQRDEKVKGVDEERHTRI